MSTDLAASCADLARWLPVAAALIAQPDTDGMSALRPPDSAESFPPWNTVVAAAALDAHEGVRRLEASLRAEVTGHTGRRRGGSDASTMAALAAIEALSHGLPERHDREYDANGKRKPCRCPHCCAGRYLYRLTEPIRQLPAVDESEPWLRVKGATCPYCNFGMLRLARRAGRVTCLRYGACTDREGNHPAGLVQQSFTGDPLVAWNDGLIQYGAMVETEPAP